ncbi:porin family protein [Psychroserpens algicola]|uniref:PorT family protein n=1 Tax=Psychroserpens algicola TaxID=1719034 RepID=A0ABT0HBS4_9FLAO|nr:porin family protein [Psychroserpens algicola]MCK8481509.1 PorT family protein [Psychroserpens algicola]
MKKLLLVTVITVLGLTTVNAQDIKFGAKAGLNFAFITGDNTEDLKPNTDFHIGVMAEWKITNKFSLQPEIIYSGQGADINVGSEGRVSLNYLNVPLIGKYYVTEKLSLEAGPQIGFLLSTKGGTLDYKELLKPIDYGVNFGLGYKLDNGLNFNLRYNLGLSNINDVDGFTDKNRNGVVQLSVGFFF